MSRRFGSRALGTLSTVARHAPKATRPPQGGPVHGAVDRKQCHSDCSPPGPSSGTGGWVVFGRRTARARVGTAGAAPIRAHGRRAWLGCERVKGIEPSLSAWETYRWCRRCPPEQVRACPCCPSADRRSLLEMARGWHGDPVQLIVLSSWLLPGRSSCRAMSKGGSLTLDRPQRRMSPRQGGAERPCPTRLPLATEARAGKLHASSEVGVFAAAVRSHKLLAPSSGAVAWANRDVPISK